MRRSLLVLLALCLSWQALAFAGMGTVVSKASAHALLHFQGAPHHHDEQGEPQQDGSLASAVHLVADSGVFSPALMTRALPQMLPAPPARPALARPFAWPPAFVDGLERPPRLAA